jgi:CRP/FNR family transcriptional regulator, polysaccharide utilization system transcription regulator
MKFVKEVDCVACTHRCDIHEVLISLDMPHEPPVKPVHVFYRRHETICKQGAKVTSAIYLLEGRAKLYIEGLNNKNIILYLLTPPNYIGLLSFFESPVYSYSVTALEDVRVCMIDLDWIRQLYLHDHGFLLRLNHAFGKSVASIMRKIITLNQKNIRGRIADSLLYLSEIYESDVFSMPLTRKELGELSAISEENTVRLLTELRKEGIIELQGREIAIVEKSLLQKISEIG